MDFNSTIISLTNKHNINLICLYILDVILFLGLLFIYKCTQIKLAHLRKGMSDEDIERMEKGLAKDIPLTGLKKIESRFETPRFDISKFEEL